MLNLTISDWIAVSATATQIIVAVLIGVWQVKKTLAITKPENIPVKKAQINPTYQFLKIYLLSLIGVAIGLFGLLHELSINESLTRSSVFMFCVYSILITANIVVIITTEMIVLGAMKTVTFIESRSSLTLRSTRTGQKRPSG